MTLRIENADKGGNRNGPNSNYNEQIVENANQSEDDGNEDSSTGCLEGTQPLLQKINRAAELAEGYKNEDLPSHGS